MSSIPVPEDFRAMLDRTVAAECGLYEGNPESYPALWSAGSDVTVMGAVGAYCHWFSP